jgi:serine/threonine-protein kinase
MGEVYRADDLKLGQAVALKFLPESAERDRSRLDRFLGEVRIARAISHPNVCRVYDVGEVDGHHFLSMEYVDGEDLRSLLRRIGRLPRDKAVQIARQLTGGLAAAHEQGVLHRDLKPSNVMIDGRGRARITDFGLSVLASESAGSDPYAGTPAYMSPEQLAGQGASVRSDIYSLGLVLYELFAGRPAFKAANAAELRRLRNESTPATPSSFVEDADPAMERVILRCLAKDPRERPASAVMVAAALPGGDPLAAAIAAGETPSPELIAEAGVVGGLTPGAALASMAALVLGLCLVVFLSGKTQLSRVVPLPKPPEVLAERAREVILKLGYSEASRDEDYRFGADAEYLDYLEKNLQGAAVWSRLRAGSPCAIRFWYRQSPRYLTPLSFTLVTYDDPPPIGPGMIRLLLQPDGRLWSFEAVPPEIEKSEHLPQQPEWTPLFEEAGLDRGAFETIEPVRSPPMYADSRAAWEGIPSWASGSKIRVEAAAVHGRPVWFRITGPWDRQAGEDPSSRSLSSRISQILSNAAILGVLIGSVLLARRNLRLGRGDRRGASTLAVFVLATSSVWWVLRSHYTPDPREIGLFLTDLSVVGFITFIVWVFYLAIEPYVRRMWPQTLVSWVRLLEGRLLDPLVGRDIVIGLLAGLAWTLAGQAWPIASRWFDLPAPQMDLGPFWQEFENLSGLRFSIGNLLIHAAAGPLFVFGFIVSLLLLRVTLRREGPALAGFVLFWTLLSSLAADHPLFFLPFVAIQFGLFIFIFLRFGIIAIMLASFIQDLMTLHPMTLDLSRWYAASSILVLVVVTALAAHGVRAALGGRPLIRDTDLQV